MIRKDQHAANILSAVKSLKHCWQSYLRRVGLSEKFCQNGASIYILAEVALKAGQ